MKTHGTRESDFGQNATSPYPRPVPLNPLLPLPMKRLTFLALAFIAAAALAADGPYDEAADAKLEIRQALREASAARVPVLVVFGANWCGDCKVLDMAMKSGASAPLIARDFRVVKVNVGRFDRNVDVATSFGIPLANGIPAVAIVSPNGDVLYATRAGELADARTMGEVGIHDFFKRAAASSRPAM
jgi:thioredoxin 1